MGPVRSYKKFRSIVNIDKTQLQVCRMTVGRRAAGSRTPSTRRGTTVGSIWLRVPTERAAIKRLVLSVNLSLYDSRSQMAIEIKNGLFKRNPLVDHNNVTTGDSWLSKRTSIHTIREINPPLVAKPAKRKRATVKRRPRGTVRN